MKIRNKVISGLVLSAVLTSGLFAMNGEMNKKMEIEKVVILKIL